MTRYDDQYASLAAACRVIDQRSYLWFGRTHRVRRRGVASLPPTDQRLQLQAALAARLYQDAYAVGRPQPTPTDGESFSFELADTAFSHALAEANASSGCWEPGWSIVAKDGDHLVVDSGALRLWVARRDLQPVAGSGLEVGAPVSVRMASGSFDLSPGYYSAFSDVPATAMAAAPILRVYFTLDPSGAAPAVAELTGRLNRAGAPFRLKVLASPAHFRRLDTAVLYVPVDSLERVLAPLATASDALRSFLRPAAPLFTGHATTGVAVAEEPGAAQSFGQHRAGLVAEAFLRAADERGHRANDRLRMIRNVLEEHGVDPTRPFLNPGSDGEACGTVMRVLATDRPRLVHAPVPEARSEPSLHADDEPSIEAGSPGGVATALAHQLIDEAVWHEDRCTWLSLVPTTDDRGRPVLAHGSIGPDLYDGTAGVAVFLSLWAATSGTRAGLETAVGAVRHALQAAGRRGRHDGLYVGRTGIAVAAALVGVTSGDYELTAAAATLADQIQDTSQGPDLLVGTAGSILGLLTLAELLGNDDLVTRARGLGTHLLDQALHSAHGLTWPGPAPGPQLTGLSHGASGIGAALAELASVTSEDAFAEAALGAFAYERAWFDPAEQNWPDLRDTTKGGARRSATYLTQWCHGAPGIALARIAALRAGIAEPSLEVEARIALTSTTRTTRAAFMTGTLSDCLCHGVGGNVDVLLTGLPWLPESDAREAAAFTAAFGESPARRHVSGGQPWVCGVPVPGVQVPGLMLGWAGIGYHFLRVAVGVHRLPSLLLPRPRELAATVHELAAAKPVTVRDTVRCSEELAHA